MCKHAICPAGRVGIYIISKRSYIESAQSRADFISKLEIALKEASETEYWLELLFRKKKLTEEQYSLLKNRCGVIRRKLIASVTTAKANSGRND